MKVKLLVNLENFQNIEFVSIESINRLDPYEEILPYVEDWIGYNGSPHPLKLANHIRKILGLDPHEVEYEGLTVVEEVEIKKQPKSTKKIPANGKYKVANTICNICEGHISWDGFVKDTGMHPIHVDKDGNIMGNGDCPEYDGDG